MPHPTDTEIIAHLIDEELKALGNDGSKLTEGAPREVAAHRDVIDAYLGRGGNFIDTANGYTKGHSEVIIGDYLARTPGRRDRVVIATANSARQAKSLARSVHDRARELGVRVYGLEGDDTGEWVSDTEIIERFASRAVVSSSRVLSTMSLIRTTWS